MRVHNKILFEKLCKKKELKNCVIGHQNIAAAI